MKTRNITILSKEILNSQTNVQAASLVVSIHICFLLIIIFLHIIFCWFILIYHCYSNLCFYKKTDARIIIILSYQEEATGFICNVCNDLLHSKCSVSHLWQAGDFKILSKIVSLCKIKNNYKHTYLQVGRSILELKKSQESM